MTSSLVVVFVVLCLIEVVDRRSCRPAGVNPAAPRPTASAARAAGSSLPLPPVIPPHARRLARYTAAFPHRDPFGRMEAVYTYPTIEDLIADANVPDEPHRGSRA